MYTGMNCIWCLPSLGTNDIRGITVCPSALNDNTYTISCDYVSGCNFSGCSYTLTSMTDTISEKIEGNNTTMIERNKVRQNIYHLTVTDLKGFIVHSKNITFNDNLCPTTTGQDFSINDYHCNYISIYYIAETNITSEDPSKSNGPSLSGGVIAAIVVLLVIALVVAIITICLIKQGEISVFFT